MVTGAHSYMNLLPHGWGEHLNMNSLAHSRRTIVLAFLKNENKTPVFKDSKFLLKVKIIGREMGTSVTQCGSRHSSTLDNLPHADRWHLSSVFNSNLEPKLLLKCPSFLTWGNHEVINLCCFSHRVCGNLLFSNRKWVWNDNYTVPCVSFKAHMTQHILHV